MNKYYRVVVRKNGKRILTTKKILTKEYAEQFKKDFFSHYLEDDTIGFSIDVYENEQLLETYLN